MDPGYCIRSSKKVQIWSKSLALGGVSIWLPNHKVGLKGLETHNTAPVPLQTILLFCVSPLTLASSSMHEMRNYLTWTEISFCNDCRPVGTAQTLRVLLCHLCENVHPWWVVERLHTCSVKLGIKDGSSLKDMALLRDFAHMELWKLAVISNLCSVGDFK